MVVNVAATARALEAAGTFEGPEYVRAYLTARKVQLKEQRAAAAEMRANFDELAARQAELRDGVLESELTIAPLSCHAGSRSHGLLSSRRSVRFCVDDAEGGGLQPLRLPLTPEELGAVENGHTADATSAPDATQTVEAERASEERSSGGEDTTALHRQLAELQQLLEHERTRTRRMVNAQVICPHCEECVPAGGSCLTESKK